MMNTGTRIAGGRRLRRAWLAAAVVALAIVMGAMAALQWRQYEVLAVALGRLDSEQVQVLDELDRLVKAPTAASALSVQQRLNSLTGRAAERGVAVRRQSALMLGLVLIQALLLIAMAVVVLRQVRSLANRRRSLEALADSLRSARQDADAANRAKSVFLANMSHEIRTPFHGMLGMMSLLQDSRLNPKQTVYLDTARESAQHLLTILNDILDISQLESGKLQVVPQTVDLLQLLNQVDALMHAQALAKGLLLRIDLAPDVPRWVRADPTRVRQILFNLLSNALKFTHEGEILLAVRSGHDGRIDFQVSDTGIGMDEATQARLFQRFMQGDEKPSRRTTGTGLGLEISRDLARLMGGDITVQSELASGSRFTVSLPLASVGAPTQTDTGETATNHGSSRPLRVLVAEDHAVNRAYLEAVLEKLGHQGIFVGDGHAAVEAVQAQAADSRFDIVLMDLHMPDMDGFTAARAIRAMPPPHGSVPIVALTADAFQTSRELAREAGMEGFLTKPAHLPQLRDALNRFAGASATPLEPEAAEEPGPLLDLPTVTGLANALTGQRYARLLDRFFADRESIMAVLRETAAADEVIDFCGHAHSLKGSSAVLGLHALSTMAQRLHNDAATAAPEELARYTARLDRLDALFELTRAECLSAGLITPPAARAQA
jgi:signal transduction histidine kinase/AmiR/NasT family two-component response regulator/HPt (histidine-containing phosphotransfer) domain-containing protein